MDENSIQKKELDNNFYKVVSAQRILELHDTAMLKTLYRIIEYCWLKDWREIYDKEKRK